MRAADPERLKDPSFARLLGITPSRWAIIVYLLDHPEGASSTVIAEAIGLSPSATGFQLRQLTQAGAITSTLDPYFVPQGQRPRYFANREAIAQSIYQLGRHAGLSVIETDNLKPDELQRKVAQRLRSILKLLDQATGDA